LCSSYLVIYGVTSIRYNHGLSDSEPRRLERWNREITWPDSADPVARADAIREQLGLFGMIPEATFTVEEGGDLTFDVLRPGRGYNIRTDRRGESVDVLEIRRSTMAAFDALHGHGVVPGSVLLAIWAAYTEVSWIFIVLAAATGLYLWATRGGSVLRWKALSASALGFVVLVYIVIS
jgi:hypothetical protein